MTASDQAVSSGGTTSADYADSYYNEQHLGEGNYGWESDHWRGFFSMVADRIIGLTEPGTVLDVGCAKGMLVQALVAGGVDATGFDISERAVETAHADVRDRLYVGSATEKIDGRFDLITCVEVLEHLAPEDAQKAIDVMCAASDRILFSSSPDDFDESTHINTHPTPQWAAWFAERGYYRRVDADTTFLTSWAILFERAELSRRSIVERYETQFDAVNREALGKRRGLLDMHRRLSQLSGSKEVELDDDAILARHAELSARDNVMGLQATVVSLQRDLASTKRRIRRLRNQLEDRTAELESLRASRALRVGRAVTAPMRKFRG